LVEVGFQSIAVSCPEGAIGSQPVVERPKWFGAYPVQAALGVSSGLDESGFSEHPKMLRDGRLTEVQVIDDVPDGSLSVTKQVEDRPAAGLAQDIKGCERLHSRSMCLRLYSCQAI
jgi:hypothetical protein